MARLYQKQGRYHEALPFFQRAVSIAEAALGPHHPTTETIRKHFKLCQDAIE
ncbi:tetratricopeptide repeat protein [Dehalococcoidia bacterium]|nr:tetratricopeptide repeat protein [Dehalococcoidia bacterium]